MESMKGSLQFWLQKRLLLILLSAFLIGIVTTYLVGRPFIESSSRKQNAWHAYFIAHSVDNLLLQEASSVRNLESVLHLLGEDHPGGDKETVHHLMQEILVHRPFINVLKVMLPDGVVLFSTHSDEVGTDVSGRSWYVSDLPDGKTVWSDVYTSNTTSLTTVACMIRVGELVYMAETDLSMLNDLVKKINMPSGTHVDILDAESRFVVGHHMEEVNTQTVHPHANEDAFKMETGSYSFRTEDGAYLASFMRLHGTSWVVAVMSTRASMLGRLWLLLASMGALMIFVGLITSVMLLIGNRKWLREFRQLQVCIHQMISGTGDAAQVLEVAPELAFAEFELLLRDFDVALEAIRLAEEEARAHAVEAENASHAKNRFIQSMGQEIRNPMTGILGAADLLRFGETDPEKLEQIRLLRSSAEVLQRTIRDVLDAAVLDSGQYAWGEEPIRVAPLLEEVVSQHVSAANRKGLEITLKWDRSIPYLLRGDGVRIRQLLGNLIENAITFTTEGIIRISAQMLGGGEGTVRVRFSVRDTGIGISHEEQKHIFQDFHQVDNGAGQRTPGMGMGLSICRRIVEAMQGTFGVESDKGKGSTFWFELMLKRQFEGDKDRRT